MKHPSLPIEHRIALYDHYKHRRAAYQKQAFNLLGSKCACGSTDNLRLRFIDPNHPMGRRYRTNPSTLYRKIFLEPELRAEVRLLCRECRLSTRAIPQLTNPGQLPLDRPNHEDMINDPNR